MADPKGLQILVRVSEILAGMVGVRPWGGNYPVDPPLVEMGHTAPRTVKSFLRIRLREASGSRSSITSINQSMNVEQLLRVRIDATFPFDEGGLRTPQEWAQLVKDDLLTTVTKNLGLVGAGGERLCSGWENPIEWVTNDGDEAGDFAQQITLTMLVTYRYRDTKEVA